MSSGTFGPLTFRCAPAGASSGGSGVEPPGRGGWVLGACGRADHWRAAVLCGAVMRRVVHRGEVGDRPTDVPVLAGWTYDPDRRTVTMILGSGLSMTMATDRVSVRAPTPRQADWPDRVELRPTWWGGDAAGEVAR